MDRRKKGIKQILPYGNQLHQNILCVGKAHGVKVTLAGILNARLWPPNILVRSLTFMEVVWTYSFPTTKVKLRKARFAITTALQDTGYIII